MTRDEKKVAIEELAKEAMQIEDVDKKSIAFMMMSIYAEGKAAGKEEERRKWEESKAAVATV